MVWVRQQEDRARQRLWVLRLFAQHELTTELIAIAAGVGRWSVFNCPDQVESGGVAELLTQDLAGGRPRRGEARAAVQWLAIGLPMRCLIRLSFDGGGASLRVPFLKRRKGVAPRF